MAPRYDALWTHSVIGRLQRETVWRRIDPLFKAGDALLDLGCGTGEDALHFMRAGMRVQGIDASSEMVRISRGRGVDASHLAIEELGAIQGAFDGVISNFGALNCVEKIDGAALAKLVRPGGHLAICTIGRFCAWESAWYLSRGEPRKACRRWTGQTTAFGIRIFYPTVPELRAALAPRFELQSWHGIGIVVPPSFVTGLSERTLATLARIDRRAGIFRSLADHRLLIFKRK